jgi:hypothetical protein
LEEAIAPDRVWSFAEPCVEPASPTNPNAILSAIATALIRLVVMFSSPPWCGRECVFRTFDIAPFNPLDTPLPDLTSPPEKRGIGGLGVHLVKSLIDDASYAREGAVNIIVLIKHVGSTV